MSDTDNKLIAPDSGGGQDNPASLEGKGWDILVGGKDNPQAAGGEDPFDLLKPPLSATPQDGAFAKDAEADAILSPSAQPLAAAVPPDAALDRGRGAEMPRDLTPADLSAPGGQPSVVIREVTPEAPTPSSAGVSAGVVFTPVGATPPPASPASSGIVELSGGAASAAIPVSLAPPASAGIVEAGPGAAMSVAPAIPSVPAPRLTPAPMSVASAPGIPTIAGVSGYGLSAPFEVSDPFSTQSGVQVTTYTADLPVNPELESLLVTPQRINALWEEISNTYDMVVNDVRGHFKTTEQAISELRKARELMLAGKENFDNAEQLVEGVKARLRLEEKVRQWSRTRGVWLGTYLVLWLLLLSLGSTASTKVAEISTAFRLPDWMPETYFPALTGALGGVVGALWVLVKHTTKNRDFDPIHTLWYATNPFMGGALGVVTYFIVRGGGGLATDVLSGGAFKLTDQVALTLYAICIVVGFNQNILWALIDRFLKAIFPQKEEENKAATDIKPGGPTSAAPGKP